MEKTIEIPEGYEARIESNKVILKRKESEDERIRKEIIFFIKEFEKDHYRCIDFSPWIAYLERQKYECEVFEPIESTLEYKAGFRAGIESERQKEQKPAEWSEEDKMHLNNAILAAEKEWGAESCTAKFLKSLRPSWKPSEEQPMPDSTQLIAEWEKEKAVLEQKDFRGDAERMAYNAFLDGFVKGIGYGCTK